MRVLLLTPIPHYLAHTLEAEGDSYVTSMEPPAQWPDECDCLISLGYRHIIPERYLDYYGRRALNIHISLLPWNRGADPNFWSWFDRTPKGISIHLIDEGVDTGDIVASHRVDDTDWSPEMETLRSSYAKLITLASLTFAVSWPRLRAFDSSVKLQPHAGNGSYHKAGEKDQWMGKLSRGWDTPVTEVEELGSSSRNN